MNTSTSISAILENGRGVSDLRDCIYSALEKPGGDQRYDRRAALYDRALASKSYNRLFWGSSPEHYRSFAEEAIRSSSEGWHLDAGCGTMLFTAEAYLEHPRRPIVVVDLSMGMLRRARERVVALAGTVPEHITFLQADILDLPFRTSSFDTVLSMGMLHLFDNAMPVVQGLEKLLVNNGHLYLTSLVTNGRWPGDFYLRLLRRAGEAATPRSPADLLTLFGGVSIPPDSFGVTGNMAYAVLPSGNYAVADRMEVGA